MTVPGDNVVKKQIFYPLGIIDLGIKGPLKDQQGKNKPPGCKRGGRKMKEDEKGRTEKEGRKKGREEEERT